MKMFEKMEKKSEGAGGIEVKKKRKCSVEKRSSVGNTDAASTTKFTADEPLPSPVQETKTSETSSNVADVPIPSPVSEAKPLEMSCVETATAKPDDTESSSTVAEMKSSEMSVDETSPVKHYGTKCSAVNVTDTEAIVSLLTVTDKVQENEQSEVIDNTMTDLRESDNKSYITDDTAVDVGEDDIKVESPQGVSESFSTPSPSKLSIQQSLSDAELLSLKSSPRKSLVQRSLGSEKLEKSPRMKLDADNTDKNDSAMDQLTLETVEAIEKEAKAFEEVPLVDGSKFDTDMKSAEDTHIAAADEPKPETSKSVQASTKAETVDNAKKPDIIASETQSTTVRQGLESRSTAKLKFGMYARKPIGSRTLVRAKEERGITSSSESDDDDDDHKDEDISSVSETAKKPKPLPVNIV